VPFQHGDSFNNRVRKLSGVEGFHVHQLRHTPRVAGWKPVVHSRHCGEILGHSSIVTTQRYGRLGDAHVQAEAERIQGRFGAVVAQNICGEAVSPVKTTAERCESG
jgi:integrase